MPKDAIATLRKAFQGGTSTTPVSSEPDKPQSGDSDTKPSTEGTSKPGDDSNSYLVQKIEGTAAVGGRMPLNSTPLSGANINLIRRWVAEGASNSGADAIPGPPPGHY